MRGLPPLAMSIAMTIVWALVLGFGLPFAAVASVILTVTWFIVRRWILLVSIFVLCLLTIYFYLRPDDFRSIVDLVVSLLPSKVTDFLGGGAGG